MVMLVMLVMLVTAVGLLLPSGAGCVGVRVVCGCTGCGRSGGEEAIQAIAEAGMLRTGEFTWFAAGGLRCVFFSSCRSTGASRSQALETSVEHLPTILAALGAYLTVTKAQTGSGDDVVVGGLGHGQRNVRIHHLHADIGGGRGNVHPIDSTRALKLHRPRAYIDVHLVHVRIGGSHSHVLSCDIEPAQPRRLAKDELGGLLRPGPGGQHHDAHIGLGEEAGRQD